MEKSVEERAKLINGGQDIYGNQTVGVAVGEGEDTYWVCANRHWELAKPVSANPEASGFYRAMQITLENKGGVVLVLDDTVLDEKGAT